MNALDQILEILTNSNLREIVDGFDDMMADKFLTATAHLDTVLCDEADEIYVKVERETLIEYLRELLVEVAA